MSVIIAGTGTNVGKTMVSAAIMARYATERSTHYLKPVQTGDESDTRTVLQLSGAPPERGLPVYAEFSLPAAPHLAAERANQPIDYGALLHYVREHSRRQCTLVELAGGLMVPVMRYGTNLDLARDLALPVILVAHTTLGTINHAVLSLMAMRQAGVFCAGVVFFGPDNALYSDNRRTISEMSGVRILGELLVAEGTIFSDTQFRRVAADFDRDGLIDAFL